MANPFPTIPVTIPSLLPSRDPSPWNRLVRKRVPLRLAPVTKKPAAGPSPKWSQLAFRMYVCCQMPGGLTEVTWSNCFLYVFFMYRVKQPIYGYQMESDTQLGSDSPWNLRCQKNVSFVEIVCCCSWSSAKSRLTFSLRRFRKKNQISGKPIPSGKLT